MAAGRSGSKSHLPPEIYVTDALPVFINVTRCSGRATRKRLIALGLAFLFGLVLGLMFVSAELRELLKTKLVNLPDRGQFGLKQISVRQN